MATGDTNDMTARLQSALPPNWFPDTAPVLSAVLQGFAAVFAQVYALYVWLLAQTRLATMTGWMIDIFALDFFAAALARRAGEADAALRARIQRELWRERATRHAVVQVLTDLVGRAPIVFEPAHPRDTGGYATPGNLAYGLAGGYGSLELPYQFFLIGLRGSLSPISGTMGCYTGTGWAGGGYGSGAIQYGSETWTESGDLDRESGDRRRYGQGRRPGDAGLRHRLDGPDQHIALDRAAQPRDRTGCRMTITSTSIGLSWTAPSGGGAVTGYTVLGRVTGSGNFAILAGGVSGTSYTVSGLVPTTSYDFEVFAGNSAGPGALSGVVTAQTLGAVPNAPASFAAAAGSPAYGSAALSWVAPSTDSTHGSAASYTVSYRVNNTGGWTVSQTGIAGLSATVSGLTHNTLYGFAVDAVNSAGTNVAGATATLTTDYAAPNVPSITAVAPTIDGTNTKLAVTWTAPATDGTHDAATGYDLQWSVHAANSWTLVSSVSSGAIITGLTAATSYDVQVRAKNGSTTSPSAWSASTTASTYTLSIVFGSLPPTTPVSHTGAWSGGGLNFVVGSTPPGGAAGWWGYATIASPVPTTGLNGPFSAGTGGSGGNSFGFYLNPPSAAGTWYVFAIVKNSVGTVIGSLVSGAITVT